jgi:CHAT domain-containing protein
MALACSSLLLAPSLAGPALAVPASAEAPASGRSPRPVFEPSRYTPAILRLSFSTGATGNGSATPAQTAQESFLDLTLLPLTGDPIGKRVPLTTAEFSALLRELYAQLSRQQPLDVDNPRSPARVLHTLLIAPLTPDLERLGITTLLIAADPGLQAVPLAALHDGQRFFGERYAFALTPALGLTPLQVPESVPEARQLAAGASRFDGLAPLPLVPQELERVSAGRGDLYLNGSFTPSVLIDKVADPQVSRVHVATHAEFLPGGPTKAKLFTGTEPFNLSRFSQLRQRRGSQPLDLIALSACRTALGDRDSELGFAGLALQAGARSAIGTLWYVDDVATSAFFVQFYRYLDAGLPKAEALQATRLAMSQGQIRRQGNQIIGPDGDVLLENLTTTQQLRVREGLQNPFFWAGITLLGTPW